MPRPGRFRRGDIALACGALLFTAVSASTDAQPTFDYPSLIQLYASGQGVAAIKALERWPQNQVSTTIKSLAGSLPSQDLVSAAVLHTECANLLVDSKPFEALFHVDAARTLLQTAAARPEGSQSTRTVLKRWYTFVVSMLISAGQLNHGAHYLRQYRLAFPNDAVSYFLDGSRAETSVQQRLARDLRRRAPYEGQNSERSEGVMKTALQSYEHALNVDPGLSRARLHLGWVWMFLGDDRRASTALHRAAEDADVDSIRYLAHLFLGDLAERANRLDEAKRELEAAVAIGPGHQTAYVALSRIESSLGDVERARALAVLCAQLVKDDNADPWWDFRIGFDRDGLNWLRMEARSR